MQGPPLSTFVANLAPSGKHSSDSGKRAKYTAQQAAGARARALLGLTELQAHALGELFSSTRSNLTDKPRLLSVCELCRFYVQYSCSEHWQPLCNLWSKGLQVGGKGRSGSGVEQGPAGGGGRGQGLGLGQGPAVCGGGGQGLWGWGLGFGCFATVEQKPIYTGRGSGAGGGTLGF